MKGVEDLGQEHLEPRQRRVHGQRPQRGFERQVHGGGTWRSVKEVWWWLMVSGSQRPVLCCLPTKGRLQWLMALDDKGSGCGCRGLGPPARQLLMTL